MKKNNSKEWEELRRLMLNRAVKFNEGVLNDGRSPCHWLIDSREVLLIPRGTYLISKLMYQKVKKLKSKSIGGLTIAANPLVSYMCLLGYQNKKPLHGFIIRKEPKYNGLQKLIEGDFKPNTSVIIVDDIVNSGGAVFQSINAVEKFGCKVEAVVLIINYFNKGFRELKQKKCKVDYLFTLKDLLIRNKDKKAKITKPKILWSKNSINKWGELVPLSSPTKYKNSILFGTNEGKFLSINQKTGKTNWTIDLKVKNPKGILSSPAIKGNKVIFGAYDGFLYCVNADTGKVIWKNRTGEWIGSSPCIYDNKVSVGVEFGIKGGALCTYNLEDGKFIWDLITSNYMHSSPAVYKKKNIVIVGCNDGFVYAAKAKTGKLLWTYQVGRETKAGFAVDEKSGLVYFGSYDGNIHCLEIETGKLNWKRRVGANVYSTPEIIKDNLVVSTVSKRIFCLNKKDGTINWYYNTDDKIYSHTTTFKDRVYCGSNDKHLYILDLKTGNLIKKYYVGKEILTKPLIHKNKIYLGCKGSFVCIGL